MSALILSELGIHVRVCTGFISDSGQVPMAGFSERGNAFLNAMKAGGIF
jgi:hypothetical protein